MNFRLLQASGLQQTFLCSFCVDIKKKLQNCLYCVIIGTRTNMHSKELKSMALRKSSIETKNRILSVCIRLFLKQGYYKTTVSQITKESGVSVSSFQNIFRTKDGVLKELVEFMFSNQFSAARAITGTDLPPVYVYAIQSAVQLVLTELNDNIRELYIEAYTLPDTADYIHESTAVEAYEIFGTYFPGYSESDFYELDIGSSGIMRNYMFRHCSIHFPLERKVLRFLTLSLQAYRVPPEEQANILSYIQTLDIVSIANQVLHQLFAAVEMHYDFTLDTPTVHPN